MYIKTESFRNKVPEQVSDVLKAQGYKEVWNIVTPHQEIIKMYNIIKNITALLRLDKGTTIVDYTRGE